MHKNILFRKKHISLFVNIFILTTLLILIKLSFNFNNNSIIYKNAMLVHYINVGQGDSILIQVNNKNLLIDSGPESNKNDLLNYLKNLNIDTLDYVIATHPHEDHIGNMQHIINTYNISAFYAPRVTTSSKTFEQMIDSLKRKNLKINVIKQGISSIDLGNNTKVTVFSPSHDSYDNLNNYSPIMKIEYKSTSFLFTGDSEKEVENEVLKNNFPLSSDVLKIGHHGSSTSTSSSFLKAVNPSICVISAGINNNYNHPSPTTLKKLQKNNCIVYRTDKYGDILLISDGNTIIKK